MSNSIDYHRLALAVAEMIDVGYSVEWLSYLMDVYGVPQDYLRPNQSESKYLYSKDLLEDLSLDLNLQHIVVDFALYIINSERFDPRYEELARKHLPIFKELVIRSGIKIEDSNNPFHNVPTWSSRDHPQMDSYFDELINSVLNSDIEPEFVKVIQSDLYQAQICYRAGAYKPSIVMLGAVLEGVMLGTLRRLDVIEYVKSMSSAPNALRNLGCNSPHFPDLMANKLRFEDYKNILRELIDDIDNLGVDNIQKFRNAIHPWKSIQEPHLYGSYESARAVHHNSALKIIVDLLVQWNPKLHL